MPPTKTCGCGCGAPVSRRFKPGHDAKLKSVLLKAAREGDQSALRQLERHGWTKFLEGGTSTPKPEVHFSAPRPITPLPTEEGEA